MGYIYLFESSVNSYGGKTLSSACSVTMKFESSVNSYGGKTRLHSKASPFCLRVV